MKRYNIAILGATGAVGREMQKILRERDFPINELRLLASARSAGNKIVFKGREITVNEAREDSFNGVDIVLGAASADLARSFAPAIKRAGAVFIDNSSAYRMDENVPLVIPEINPEDALLHDGLIANPNCSTIVTLMAAYPISRISPITSMTASTYQAVSGAGAGGFAELDKQVREYTTGAPITNGVFPYQIAFNLIPQIGSATDNLYTTEEMKMQNEGRKIMHLPELTVCCTCVRVPVMRSHSISVTLRTKEPVTVEAAREAIANAAGCKLVDDISHNRYPMPLDTSDQDIVYVGRLRYDITQKNALTFFCCGDQLRKGAATNAVQIAELLIEK